MLKKGERGKVFENLGKNVQNLKNFLKRTGFACPTRIACPTRKVFLKIMQNSLKDAAGQRCSPKNRRRNNFRKSSAKKVFLKINYVLRKTVAPLMNMQAKDLQVIKKRFQHLYFIVNFD